MKKYKKTLLIVNFLLISSIAMAFPADPDLTPDPPASIETNIILLLVSGIGLTFWVNSKKSEKS